MTRVLVYDRDGLRAERYKDLLSSMHLWVVTATDLETARDLLRKQYFHLCLWPIESVDKIEEIYRLKKDRAATSIVVLSDRADAAIVVGVMRAGASNFWHRQTELSGLAEVLTDTLSRIVVDPVEEGSIEFPFPQFVGRHPKILRSSNSS